MKRLPKAYSREKRKDQIIGQFCIWSENGDTKPKTMYRIARALAMTPSVKIYAMLDELIHEGKLTYEMRDQSGRWATRFYSLTQPREHYHEKYGKRRIVVKHKGVVSAQLDMGI